MRILQCIKASGNRSIARAAIIGLLMSVAVALIVVNRLNSRVSAQSDSASTQARCHFDFRSLCALLVYGAGICLDH